MAMTIATGTRQMAATIQAVKLRREGCTAERQSHGSLNPIEKGPWPLPKYLIKSTSTLPVKTVVILGATPKEDRFAFRAMRMLQAHGHRAIPVNPAFTDIL